MKILFLCPDYFGIYKVIQDEIKQQFNCDLKSVIFEDYVYKSKTQKIMNFLAKTFLKKNLKKIWASKHRIKTISSDDNFDFVFVICPDFLTNEDLKYVTDKGKKTITYYWDSFDNIPRYERTLPFFDTKYSFEPKDIEKYNLQFLTNFYYKSDRFENTPLDVFFIGTFDDRFPVIKQIAKLVKDKNRNSKIILQSDNNKLIEENSTAEINFIKKPISVTESSEIFKNSKIILDVQKTIQQGLTFRVFEAMGFGKKLITTNSDIINYDFYNPNNIFVWTENTIEIPNSFFETPYQELPEEIYTKYSISTWIGTIFS